MALLVFFCKACNKEFEKIITALANISNTACETCGGQAVRVEIPRSSFQRKPKKRH